MGERVLLAFGFVYDSHLKERLEQEVPGLAVDLLNCAVFGSRL